MSIKWHVEENVAPRTLTWLTTTSLNVKSVKKDCISSSEDATLEIEAFGVRLIVARLVVRRDKVSSATYPSQLISCRCTQHVADVLYRVSNAVTTPIPKASPEPPAGLLVRFGANPEDYSKSYKFLVMKPVPPVRKRRSIRAVPGKQRQQYLLLSWEQGTTDRFLVATPHLPRRHNRYLSVSQDSRSRYVGSTFWAIRESKP